MSVQKNSKKVDKRFLSLIILGIYLVSIFAFSINLVSAQMQIPYDPVNPNVPDNSKIGYEDITSGDTGWFSVRWNLWKQGANSLSGGSCVGGESCINQEQTICTTISGCEWKTNISIIGETLKYILLIMVILLVYMGLGYFNFHSTILKVSLSVVIGFLATFLVTTNELITSLMGYTALGLTIQILLPLIALGGITIMMSSKGGPTGVYLTRVAWAIYAAYLFFKTIGIFLILRFFQLQNVNGVNILTPIQERLTKTGNLPWYMRFFIDTSEAGIKQASTYMSAVDMTTAIILLITSIAVTVFMVFGYDYINELLAQSRIKAEAESQRIKVGRTQAWEDARANAVANEKGSK